MIKPLHNKIVVEEIQTENVSSSGIILSGGIGDIKRCRVISIGDKVIDVKVNDTLIIDWQYASKTNFNNKTLFIIKEDDVICVIE